MHHFVGVDPVWYISPLDGSEVILSGITIPVAS